MSVVAAFQGIKALPRVVQHVMDDFVELLVVEKLALENFECGFPVLGGCRVRIGEQRVTDGLGFSRGQLPDAADIVHQPGLQRFGIYA